MKVHYECQTLAGIVRMAAGQRSTLADQGLQSVKQHGSRQTARVKESINTDLLQKYRQLSVSSRC